MAITTAKQSASSIGMALAGKSHRVDIPLPRENGSYASAAVSGQARSGSASQAQGVDLPTPPASISPSLPPQAYLQHNQALGLASPPSPPGHGVESDFDLQDAVEHARAQDTISHPKRRDPAPEAVAQSAPAKSLDASSLAALESSNAVTAAMLARDHLPNILLENGPLAIRYIMGFLTQTVPGFSTIPGAKARRLVVAALESGYSEEVEFEKVGWGRWDAHKRGERRASRQSSPGRELSGLPRYSSSSRDRSQLSSSRERSLERTYGSYPSQPTSSLRIPNNPRPRPSMAKRTMSAQFGKSLSPNLGPTHFFEGDADRMSLDGDDDDRSGGGSSTTNPDDLPDQDMDEATDEEDWASIGAAALRAGSISHSHGTNRMLSGFSHSYSAKHTMTLSHRTRRDSANHAGVHKRTGGMRQSSFAKSAPSPKLLAASGKNLKHVREHALEGCVDDNERQAAAALLSLGAV